MSPPIPINLAVEDELSEFAQRRILATKPTFHIATVYRKGGYGYLKTSTPAFNNAAKGIPFLLLTDLDKGGCPPDLVKSWLDGRTRHPRFLFRVAVPEVESWLLADSDGFRKFLGLRGGFDVLQPESLTDAKTELLVWAEKARARSMREALVFRDKDGKRDQGPDYNGTLAYFVQHKWDLRTAVGRCPSLAGLVRALRTLELEWPRNSR